MLRNINVPIGNIRIRLRRAISKTLRIFLPVLLAAALSSCAGAYADNLVGNSSPVSPDASTTALKVSSGSSTGNGASSSVSAATASGSGTSGDNGNSGSTGGNESFAAYDPSTTAVTAAIRLNGSSVSYSGSGITASGSRITITSPGTYVVSGILDNGQIIIDTGSKEPVRLVLNGAAINCSDNPPIYGADSKNITIELAAGTTNTVSDKNAYIFPAGTEDEPWGAIFSKGNLTFTGTGSLAVIANYKHGIVSKDKLNIESGNITITAAADGIRGRDSVTVYGGNIGITAGSDGIQSDNGEDEGKGNVTVKGGTLNITAGNDGIQAISMLTLDAGTISITTGGGSSNSIHTVAAAQAGGWAGQPVSSPDTASSGDSAKGLKAQIRLVINGGTININSSDDSIHANDTVIINNGDITISSGDDAIHADKELEINNGGISIKKCFEGIESAIIRLNGGDIRLSSSDDGINVAGGNDGSSIGGRPGQNSFISTGNDCLYINGGYYYLETVGDGIDINGSVEMTAGTLIINGPTSNNNGAIDYDGTFKLTGGYIITAGSAGMAQAPGAGSTQYSLLLNFSTAYAAGILVHIEDSDGNDILTFSPSKTFQSITFTSPVLEKGETYKVYTGGSATGTSASGLYGSGSSYAPGNLYTSFTVSSITTSLGSMGGMGGMPGGGGRR